MLIQGLTSLTSLDLLYDLATRCQLADGYPVKIYWNVLEDRQQDPSTLDFLLFKSSKLIGVLNVYFFTDSVEMTAMVDPDYREMGIFRKLLNTALHHLNIYDLTSYLLICHTNAQSFTEKLQSWGATLDHSEIEMIAPSNIECVPKHDLLLQLATTDDIELILELHQQCFPNPPADVMRRRFMVTLLEPHRRVYLAKNPAGEYVGKLHVREEKLAVYLHDIGIIPSKQRQGYGQSLMYTWHKQISADYNRNILIEVLSDNYPALRLYELCGFKITNQYNFWRFSLTSK